MMPIWRIQANAIAILVIALAIPAIAGMAAQFNQDIPSWFYSPVTGVVTLVVIGAALAVLTTTLFIKNKEEE
jgi:hypothetical protein